MHLYLIYYKATNRRKEVIILTESKPVSGVNLTDSEIVQTMFGEECPKPMNISIKRVDVIIDPGRGLLQDLTDQYVIEINRLARARLRANDDYITPEELFSYMTTLILMRCRIAREEKLGEYNQLKYSVRIPTFIAYCLSQMGQAKDSQFGLILIPKFGGKEENIITPIEMRSISDKLGDLEEYGLKQVLGLDKSSTGSIGYMATNLAETAINGDTASVVQSWRKDHEVFGIIGAVFAAQQLHGMFTNYNVMYGILDEYRLGLSQIVRSTTKSREV